MTQNAPASLDNYFSLIASAFRSTQEIVVQIMKNNGTFSEVIRYYLTHAHMLNGCSPHYLLSIAVIVEAAFAGLVINLTEFLVINPDKTESFHVGVKSQGFFYDICSQKTYSLTKFANCTSRELIQTKTLLELGKMKESVQAFYSSNLNSCLPSECKKSRNYLTFNNQDKNSAAIKVGILIPFLYERFRDTLTLPVYIENPIIAEQVQTNIFRDFVWLIIELKTGGISKKSKYPDKSIEERLNGLIPNVYFKDLILILCYKHSEPEKYESKLVKFIVSLQALAPVDDYEWVSNTVHRFLINDNFDIIERKAYAYGFIQYGEGYKSYQSFINNLTHLTINEVLLNTQESSRKVLEPYYYHVAFLNSGVLFDERMKALWMLLEEAQFLVTRDAQISQFKIHDSDETRTAIIVGNRSYDLGNRKLYPRQGYEKLINASTEVLLNRVKLGSIHTPSFIENMIKICETKYSSTQNKIIIREGKNLIKAIDCVACFKYLSGRLNDSFKDEVLNYFPDIAQRIRQQIFGELVRLYGLLPEEHAQKSDLAFTIGCELSLVVIYNSFLVVYPGDFIENKDNFSLASTACKILQQLNNKYLANSALNSAFDNWFQVVIKETLAKYSLLVQAKIDKEINTEASESRILLSTNPHSLYAQAPSPEEEMDSDNLKNNLGKG